MNIFYLAEFPQVCASYMFDTHVRKMCLEYAQMLSTAHYVLDGEQVGYKPTHANHPCSKWVRESNGNYIWLWAALSACYNEFFYRFGKDHKGFKDGLLSTLHDYPRNITKLSVKEPNFKTEVPQCMPDEFKNDDPIIAYRNYYMGDKRRLAKWTKREQPEWWT